MGLPRDLRLRHKREFDAVFQQARAWNDNLLVLRALPNTVDHNRYGFVTSKRLGGAVVRNRVRRRLREITREAEVTGGYDVVLSAKKAAADAPFADLRASAARLFGRAGLTKAAQS